MEVTTLTPELERTVFVLRTVQFILGEKKFQEQIAEGITEQFIRALLMLTTGPIADEQEREICSRLGIEYQDWEEED